MVSKNIYLLNQIKAVHKQLKLINSKQLVIISIINVSINEDKATHIESVSL